MLLESRLRAVFLSQKITGMWQAWNRAIKCCRDYRNNHDMNNCILCEFLFFVAME